MNLTAPITFAPPSITLADGTVKTFNPITLDKLEIIIIDNPALKICGVQIRPCPMPLVLWEKEAYDAIGDYTQVQVEDRVRELLSVNPAEVLTSLFPKPPVPTASN